MTTAKTARRLAAMLLALGFVASSVMPVGAQETSPGDAQPPDGGRSALSVSPAIVETGGDPGATFTTEITVTNITNAPMAIRATARELVPEEQVDPAYKAAFDASAWFQIDGADFLLLSQQQRTVRVTVTIPKDAEPGGHYATVYFESFVPEQANANATTVINARVGVLALLVVKGSVREHATTGKPIGAQSLQAEAGPTTLTAQITNDGNVHLLPFGKVTIRDVFGRKVKELPLPLGIVLPGTTRSYDITWEHGLRLGVYKAEATFIVGTQQVKLEPRSTRFVLLPLVVVVPALLLLFLVVTLATMPRRKRRRRARARARAVAMLNRRPSTEPTDEGGDGSTTMTAEDESKPQSGEPRA